MRPRESEAWHRSRPTERILGEVVVVGGASSSAARPAVPHS